MWDACLLTAGLLQDNITWRMESRKTFISRAGILGESFTTHHLIRL